jgi:alpha-mannosidase
MANTSVPLNQLVLPRVRKILNRKVKNRLWESETELDVQVGPVHTDPVTFSKASKEKFKPIKSGDIYSPKSKGEHGEFPWDHRWFKVKVPAPKKGEKGKRYLRWCASGEFNIYLDGSPWCGLDVAHTEAPLPDKACTLYIECGLWQTGIWGQEGEWLRPVDGFIGKFITI